MANIHRRLATVLTAFTVVTLAVLVLAPTVGSTQISLSRAFDRSVPWADNVDAQIFFIARLPRVLAGALVGSTLAAAGVVLQALLRNPLATPFTLGVSASAALGAMLAIVFNLDGSAFGVAAVPVASFAGSIIGTAMVYFLATRVGAGLSTNVLLLAGVTLNTFFSALITFVQYLVDFSDWYRTARWLLGNLDVSGFGPILAASPLILLSFALFALLPRTLNLLTLGDDLAAGRGVNVGRAQRLAFLSASLATGAAISMAGPIGFIGIVVPHLVRLLVGADHRIVLPAATLFGAAFLVACDLIARTDHGAGRAASRHRHGHDRRAIFSVAAREESMTTRVSTRARTLAAVLLLAAGTLTAASAQRPATRVVSLVPALTEMVFAIGAGGSLMAVSSYDEFPPEVKSLPRVGALLDPDVERILALKPDLVLLYGSQTDLMAQLSRASVPYFEYRHGGLSTVTTTIRGLGDRTGRAEAAGALAASIERRFAELRRRTAARPKPRTLLIFARERGSMRNIYASGGRGFLHDMLEAAGGVNVFADIPAESVQASSEQILARAPEVILELRATDTVTPAEQQEAIAAWSVLGSVPAVKNHRVRVLGGRGLVVPGPRVADSAETIERALHP